MTNKDALLREFLDLVPRMSDDDPIAPALADLCKRTKAALSQPDAAPGDAVCPHIVTSREGTTYCRLAESGPQPAEAREALETIKHNFLHVESVCELPAYSLEFAWLKKQVSKIDAILAKHAAPSSTGGRGE